ncbi:hypothetical protein RND71_004107 [Anisodus tanguticus]|uniref:Uncharacterized protein n=1 Tax=Anisodus tanguticus TaxID=243964 RepID=A0AAE1T004_9SOLA|nr:hypothetical protein RND71_004107 [Anisodus tanguticus]
MEKIKNKKSKKTSVSIKEEIIAKQYLIAPQEQEDDDEGFGLKDSVQSDNHGVQPLGNLYISPSFHNSRNTGLGGIY